MLISFLGALPLGTLNITAFHISASLGVIKAIYFSMGVLLVETSIVYATLKMDHLFKIQEKHRQLVFIIIIIVLVILSLVTIYKAYNGNTISNNSFGWSFFGASFVYGLLLSLLNPLQFPYWIGWNKVLLNKNILNFSSTSIRTYVTGIGIGTFLALYAFTIGGQLIADNYSTYQKITGLIMGLVYGGFAIYLLDKLIKKQKKQHVV